MTKQFQVVFEYHYFKHLANAPVVSRMTVQALTARAAIAKAMQREQKFVAQGARPIDYNKLIQIVATEQQARV